jgi:hypothetical protein
LAHWALVGLPKGLSQREAAFIDKVNDQNVEQHLLMCSETSLNETLNYTLKPDPAKAAARTSVKLEVVKAGAPMGT